MNNTTHTATAFLTSPRFLEMVGSEAISFLAEHHGTDESTIKANLLKSENLQRQLAELVREVAKAAAK